MTFKARIRNGRIGILYFSGDAICYLPFFEANACSIKYFRGIPWAQSKKKERFSETSYCSPAIGFRINGEEELCVIVCGQEESLCYPLAYIKEVKLMP